MVLSGDDNVPAMPLAESQVNHLRRLLAWMRCEYMLDEHMQRGYVSGASRMAEIYPDRREHVNAIVQEKVDLVNHVPAYVRQAVKMLTKALREHDARSGVMDANPEPETAAASGPRSNGSDAREPEHAGNDPNPKEVPDEGAR
jgi:hypothetical protein